MSSISSPNHKRRNTLELRGDQSVATDEQIRQHCPELFEVDFYVERIQEELAKLNFNSLKFSLPKEVVGRFDAYAADLADRALKQLSEIPMEFAVQHESEESQDEAVTEDRNITVAVSNISALLTSIKEPAQELEKLHQLSALINKLKSKIDRIKGSIPNFKEHLRRHEIEVETLKGELKDLEEQEREGGLNRAEKIQKEQLEKAVGGHQADIAKNSKKLNKRKEQISAHQKKIAQIIQTLIQFLDEFNLNDPKSLPESLDPDRFTSDNIQFAALSLTSNLQKILQGKREGKYTAYNADLAKSLKWMERRQSLAKWSRRLILPLIIMGVAAHINRERITDFIRGPKIDPNGWGWGEDTPMPTDPELVEQLEANNPEIAVYKVGILNSTTKITKKERKAIIEAKDMTEFGEVFWPLIHWDFKRDGDDFVVAFMPDKVALMKAYHGVEGDYLSTGYTIDDVEKAEPSGFLNGSFTIPKDVLCHPNFKLFFKLWMQGDYWMTVSTWPLDSRQKSMCRKNPRTSPDSEKNPELANLKEKILNHPLFVRHITLEDKLELTGLSKEVDLIGFTNYMIRKTKGSIKPGSKEITVQLGPNEYKLLRELFGEDYMIKSLPMYPGGNPKVKPYVVKALKNPFFSHHLNEAEQLGVATSGSLYELKQTLVEYAPVLNVVPSESDLNTYKVTIDPDATNALKEIFGDKIRFGLQRIINGANFTLFGINLPSSEQHKLNLQIPKSEYCKPENSPALAIFTDDPSGSGAIETETFRSKPKESLRQLCTITLNAVTPTGEPLEEDDYQELIDSIEVGKPRKISK